MIQTLNMRGSEIIAETRRKNVMARSGMRAHIVSTSVSTMLIMYQAVSLHRYKTSKLPATAST